MQTKRRIKSKQLEKLLNKKLTKLLNDYYEYLDCWVKFDSINYLQGEFCAPCQVYFFYRTHQNVAKRICCEIDAYDKDTTILLKVFSSIIKEDDAIKLEKKWKEENEKLQKRICYD